MYRILFTVICFLGLILMTTANGQFRYCSKVYCLLEEDTGNPQSAVLPQSRRTHSRPGKRGPAGPPGTVNYTRIDESLRVKYEEFEAGIAEKMKEFQTRMEESLAHNEEVFNNRTNELRELEAKIDAKIAMLGIGNPVPTSVNDISPKSCDDICRKIINSEIRNQPLGFATKGRQSRVFPEGFPGGLEVYCDCSSGDGDEAWTVFQRRMDGSQDFYQNWQSYVNGFGSKTGEFWLGLDALSKLASNPNEFELRIDLMDWENEKRFAEYSSFSIGDTSTNYKLTVDGYSGNAGDSLLGRGHNQKAFTTHDVDNDMWNSENCADLNHGAWWFDNCFSSHLNGKYYREDETRSTWRGIIWYDWKGSRYSLKATEMKMRKKN